MSPYKKKTRSTNKISESTNTIISHPVISTNNDNNASTSQDPDPVPVIINPPRIPAHFASLLRLFPSHWIGFTDPRPSYSRVHQLAGTLPSLVHRAQCLVSLSHYHTIY